MEPLEDAATVERMLLDQARRIRTPANGSIELLPLCNMNCDMCYVRLSREEMEAKGRLRTADEWWKRRGDCVQRTSGWRSEGR